MDEFGFPVLSTMVHIRMQQRNSRKCITTVEGLPEIHDLKKILKHAKKLLNCNGSISSDDNGFKILQLQGDKRRELCEFFAAQEIVHKDEVKVHGF
jgi:translation initiation factor SUI1